MHDERPPVRRREPIEHPQRDPEQQLDHNLKHELSHSTMPYVVGAHRAAVTTGSSVGNRARKPDVRVCREDPRAREWRFGARNEVHGGCEWDTPRQGLFCARATDEAFANRQTFVLVRKSMLGHVPAALSAFVGDAFNAATWQGGNVAGLAFGVAAQHLLRRRAEAARDILLDEIRRGDKDLTAQEVDAVVAVLLRYGRAAQEGAARLNLRLMAQVIVGQARLGCLYADEFLRYADILASLRREEVLLLGVMQRHWEADGEPEPKKATARSQADLIPGVFKTHDDFNAAAGAVTRTGLLMAQAAYGVLQFRPTQLLADLCRLAPFETTARAEPA